MLPRSLPGAALSVVVAGTILRETFGLVWLQPLGTAALILYVASQAARLPSSGKVILILAVAAGIAGMPFVPDLAATLAKAARTSCYYATLFTVVTLLRAAAESSEMIRRCGRNLIQQPPSRRYLALTLGANAFGLILAFGALQLLGTMARRANTLAAAGGDPAIMAIRGRRLFTAVLRGVAMSPGWSPMSVALAISLSFTPGSHWQSVVPIAFVTVLGLLLLGWLFDVATSPRARPRLDDPADRVPWTVHLRLVALILALFFSAVALEHLLKVRLIDAVIFCVPAYAAGWLTLQGWRWGPWRAFRLTLRRLGRQARDVFPNYRMELTILSSAGFAGTLVAAALPTELIAAGIRELALPSVLVPAGILLFVVIGGQLALNPIITVTIAAAILPSPQALGVAPAVMAASYMIAWGLCVGSSPFALTTMIIAAIAGKTGSIVGHVWNGVYSIVALVLSSAWLGLMSWLLLR